MSESRQNSRQWTCPLCDKSLKSPVVTRCGHIFCWPCISKALEGSEVCPTCNKTVARGDLVPIYGQTGETNTDAPRPPRQPQEPPPNEEEEAIRQQPGRMRFGNWDIDFQMYPLGLMAFGFFFQWAHIGGRWRNQNQNQNVVATLFGMLFPILLLMVMTMFLS